jgi:hypothetical protein
MKLRSILHLLMIVTAFAVKPSFAQVQPTYQVPDSYRFDYEVSQSLISHKHSGDSCTLHFFYTKTGDYAAVRINGKGGKMENIFLVLTRDNSAIIFNEQKKNITIISVRKLIADLASLTKWIKMDSLMAHMRQKTNGKELQSVKTGHTKQIGSYTEDEYSLSDGKGHKGSVWCAKVDFNAPGDYILGSGGNNILKMMSAQIGSHPLLLALTQPKTLVTEIDGGDSTNGLGMNLHTESIMPTSTIISTSGYQVNNYSNMTLPEIFQEEMKKKNN